MFYNTKLIKHWISLRIKLKREISNVYDGVLSTFGNVIHTGFNGVSGDDDGYAAVWCFVDNSLSHFVLSAEDSNTIDGSINIC